MKFFRPPKVEETQGHYDHLVADTNFRKTLGMQSRFNTDEAVRSASVRKYFTEKIRPLIRPTDRVLDLGCGAGVFLPILSPMCRELVGIDVAQAFVDESNRTIERFGLKNTRAVTARSEALPFEDNEFDVALLAHVIHHVYHLEETIAEVKRVTKPGARVLVYEPNKLNPAIFMVHLLDRNEWGAIGLGRKGLYRRLFGRDFDIERMEFNGLIISHDAHLSQKITEVLNAPVVNRFAGWLNSAIFISMINRKPAG